MGGHTPGCVIGAIVVLLCSCSQSALVLESDCGVDAEACDGDVDTGSGADTAGGDGDALPVGICHDWNGLQCEPGHLSYAHGGTCVATVECAHATTALVTLVCYPGLDCSVGCAAPGADPDLATFEALGISPTHLPGDDAVDCCGLLQDLGNLGFSCAGE